MNYLRKNYKNEDRQVIVKKMNKNWSAISQLAYRYGLKRKRKDNRGKNNPNWKGGVWCVDCRKAIWYTAIRCRHCMVKWQKGKNHHNYGLRLFGKDNPRWRGGPRKCNVCNKTFSHRSKKTSVCRSCYTKERNHAWNGGTSKLPYPFDFNNQLKELIRKRDNYKCQLCGVPQKECIKKLSVHHIDYCKENLSPNNLISLCMNCHSKTTWKRREYKSHFYQKEFN